MCKSNTGGPAGGNGGDGGHIWAVVDTGLNSLSTFRKQLHFRGSQGSGGGGSGRHGACGEDIEIRVPRGTIVREKDAAEGAPALAELLKEGIPLPLLSLLLSTLKTAYFAESLFISM